MVGEFDRIKEADTRADLIDPALARAGWNNDYGSDTKIKREHGVSAGRLLGGGRRAAALSVDYVLVYKDRALAVVEAKKSTLSHSEGVAQAKDYAQRLGTRIAYATNGKVIYQIDMETGKESEVDGYLSPDEIWAMQFAPTPDDIENAESWAVTRHLRPFGEVSLARYRLRPQGAGSRAIINPARLTPRLTALQRARNAYY